MVLVPALRRVTQMGWKHFPGLVAAVRNVTRRNKLIFLERRVDSATYLRRLTVPGVTFCIESSRISSRNVLKI